MRESQIEAYLVRLVLALGGLALKWVSPGRPGVPDRIVFLPGARLLFVEVKAADGRVSPVQSRLFAWLARLGFPVHVVRSTADVDALLA